MSGFDKCPFCGWVPGKADLAPQDDDVLLTHHCQHAWHRDPAVQVGMKIEILGHSLEAIQAAWNARAEQERSAA